VLDRLHRSQAAKIIVKHQAPSAKGYELTEMGRDLVTVLGALRQWGDRWQLHGTSGPPLEAFDTQSGSPVEIAMIATGTGQRISPGQLVLTAGPGADERVRFQLRAGQPDQTTAQPTSGRALLPVPNALPDEGLE
jgi:hypothetical protein